MNVIKYFVQYVRLFQLNDEDAFHHLTIECIWCAQIEWNEK